MNLQYTPNFGSRQDFPAMQRAFLLFSPNVPVSGTLGIGDSPHMKSMLAHLKNAGGCPGVHFLMRSQCTRDFLEGREF